MKNDKNCAVCGEPDHSKGQTHPFAPNNKEKCCRECGCPNRYLKMEEGTKCFRHSLAEAFTETACHNSDCPCHRPAHSTEEIDRKIADYNESKANGTLNEKYPVIAKIEEPQGESGRKVFSYVPENGEITFNGTPYVPKHLLSQTKREADEECAERVRKLYTSGYEEGMTDGGIFERERILKIVEDKK